MRIETESFTDSSHNHRLEFISISLFTSRLTCVTSLFREVKKRTEQYIEKANEREKESHTHTYSTGIVSILFCRLTCLCVVTVRYCFYDRNFFIERKSELLEITFIVDEIHLSRRMQFDFNVRDSL